MVPGDYLVVLMEVGRYFFSIFVVCQIHSEVLKHVLQRGGGDI